LGFILLGSHVGGFDVLQYLTPRSKPCKITRNIESKPADRMQSKWVAPFFVCSPIRVFHLMLKRPKTETLPSTLHSKDNKVGDMFLHNTATF
jgi:hypothetical protein